MSCLTDPATTSHRPGYNDAGFNAMSGLPTARLRCWHDVWHLSADTSRLRIACSLSDKKDFMNVHACLVQGPSVDTGDRSATVYHFRARSGDRAVQSGNRGIVPVAERAAAGAARRVAGTDQGRAGRA